MNQTDVETTAAALFADADHPYMRLVVAALTEALRHGDVSFAVYCRHDCEAEIDPTPDAIVAVLKRASRSLVEGLQVSAPTGTHTS